MFERMQTAEHEIENNLISVSYDRLSTRFSIRANEKIIFSKLLLFLPIHNANLSLGENTYKLKIRWFILWRSSLSLNKKIIIKELLYRRRKRSIGLFIYFLLISLIKITIGFTS